MADVEEEDLAGPDFPQNKQSSGRSRFVSVATGKDKKQPPSLAKAFEALQAGPIYQVKPPPPKNNVVTNPAQEVTNDMSRAKSTRTAAVGGMMSHSRLEEEHEGKGEGSNTRKRKIPGGKGRGIQSKGGRGGGRKKTRKGVQGLAIASGEEVSDELRCRRSDGKEWRCKNPRVDGLSFCIHHASRFKRAAIEAGILPAPPGGLGPSRGGKKGTKKGKGRKAAAAGMAQPRLAAGKEGVQTRRGRPAGVTAEEAIVGDDRVLEAPEEGTSIAREAVPLAKPPELYSSSHAAAPMVPPASRTVPLVDSGVQTEDDLAAPVADLEAKKEGSIEVKAANGAQVSPDEPTGPRKLYWEPGSSSCWRVQLALEEKGLDYESTPLDLLKREGNEGEFAALNPRGQVPTLVDGEMVVSESGAACQYLDWAYPSSAPQLLPHDRKLRAEVLQRMYESSHYDAVHREALDFYQTGSLEDPLKEEAWGQKKAALKGELSRWEVILKDKKFLVGDSLTLADLFFFPLLASSVHWGLQLDKAGCPHLAGYHAHLSQRESVIKTLPLHWKDRPEQLVFADVS